MIASITSGHFQGGVAQMVERSLSMREVPGSIPGISRPFSASACGYIERFPSEMIMNVKIEKLYECNS